MIVKCIWFIINIKAITILACVSLSTTFVQIMYAFVCKYQFQQTSDEIRELCQKYGTNGNTFTQYDYLYDYFIVRSL
jgi:hypothetical protein